MEKLLSLLTAMLLAVSTGAYAAPPTSGTIRLLDQISATSTYGYYTSGDVVTNHYVEVTVTAGSPTVLVVLLEGTKDGSTWSTLDTHTFTAAELTAGEAKYTVRDTTASTEVRISLSTNTGTGTVDIDYCPFTDPSKVRYALGTSRTVVPGGHINVGGISVGESFNDTSVSGITGLTLKTSDAAPTARTDGVVMYGAANSTSSITVLGLKTDGGAGTVTTSPGAADAWLLIEVDGTAYYLNMTAQ